jgi:hypothetical protein
MWSNCEADIVERTHTKEIALQIIARFPVTRSNCQVIVHVIVHRMASMSFAKRQLRIKHRLSKSNARDVAEGCYRGSELLKPKFNIGEIVAGGILIIRGSRSRSPISAFSMLY